ncbi:MAG: ABC transporter ATP-binding protein [Rectinemataceae bacterium]|nr:ABC transporter ATP-binding protein [Rectinemataceae bacterium]
MRVDEARSVETVIECQHVSKAFTTRRGTKSVIGDISLKIRKNEFVVLFGPGQCGKTSLMNILSGLDEASSGLVSSRGERVVKPQHTRGVVFQSMALFPWLTVRGNVAFGLKARGFAKEVWKAKSDHYIDLVGLKGFEDAFINRLSGGMKQRVGIARAYCNDPEVLFMDEPFSALDAQTRYLMQEEIRRIWSAEKKTIVFITNNIEEAVYLADRIILLTNCPANIKKEYQIDLPHPRDYTSAEFLALRDEISKNMDSTL